MGKNDKHQDCRDEHELRQQKLRRRFANRFVPCLPRAQEDGIGQAEHVEKADEGRDHAKRDQPIPSLVHHGAEQQPLATEAGERRQARHRDEGYDHGGEGERHAPGKAAVLVHEPRAGAQDDAGDSEEQDALHHQMVGDEVERCHPAEMAHQRDGGDDVAELAHAGIGEQTFDVVC